jgi:hypothetical protein
MTSSRPFEARPVEARPVEARPVEAQTVDRPDWRESLSTAADLALIGFLTAFGCLLVVPAGAAVSTASVAVDHLCRTRSLPPMRDLVATATRSLLPGLAALGVAAGGGLLIALDVRLLAAGTIPGGPVAVAAIAVVAAFLVAAAGVTVVRVGQTGGTGWVPALRWSLRLLRARPLTGVAVLATVAVPVALALAVPVLAFLLPGFALFALHVVIRRA